MHTLICETFSLPPGVGGWLRRLIVALVGLFCLPFCICLHNLMRIRHHTLQNAVLDQEDNQDQVVPGA